jgi:endonuclease/exonuclease/phosphatase family metal-dependent hydrolase
MPPLMDQDYNLKEEKLAASDLLIKRDVPEKSGDNLLIETWNIEKLGSKGARKRKRQDHELIAELIKPFDIIAVQEVMSDLWGIREIMESLNEPFKMVITDVGGNSERLVYIYDSSRVKTRELFAEIAIPESDRKKYDPPDIPRKFKGFNRNPFLVSFERNEFSFILANVHIYFGRVSGVEYMNRLVEVYALAKWADDQRRSKTTYDKDIILIGDMNVPKMDQSDQVYIQLTRFGYVPTNWSTKVGTSLSGTDHYDQIVISPGIDPGLRRSAQGVLNFDKHLFRSVWDRNNLDPDSESDLKKWRKYCETRISDHRPLWVEFS